MRDLLLHCTLHEFGQPLADALRENRGPRKVKLSAGGDPDPVGYRQSVAALSSSAVIKELYVLNANRDEALQGVLLSLLVEALPRAEGLVTLGLPEVQRTFSYGPWKSLWTSVA
jgi:hypothetical protein